MKIRVGKFLRTVVPHPVVEFTRRMACTLDPHTNLSYAQEGEDMIVLRFLNWRRDGFYVDVGAHHPYRFSNTAMLHRLGWKGINIDADPTLMASFRRYRPHDVNLGMGVSNISGSMRFHVFDEPALNTFDDSVAHEISRDGHYKEISCIDVPVERLDTILTKHVVAGQKIDLLNIDVEGYQLKVLRSNDWTRFRPGCILVEQRSQSAQDALQSDVHQLLSEVRYELFAKTVNTLLFRDSERPTS